MPAPRIQSLATAVPPARHTQEEVLAHFGRYFPAYRQDRVAQLFLNAGIESRHLALLPEEFHPENSANELHSVYQANALALAREAACAALRQASLEPAEIDLLVVATCTGYICPGLTARLAASMRMSRNLQRADLVGMGCAGAVPALQRGADFVKANPGKRALVVCVEISSACWFIDDTVETIVGNAICADGAAAVVLSLDDGPGPTLEKFHTLMDPSFLESVGLSFENGRQRIVLDAGLRHAAGPMVKEAVAGLLAEDPGFQPQHWVVHAGGKRVLDSIDSAFAFANGELAFSRETLRNYGNMSSPTVLFVLEKTLRATQPNDTAILVALGPGLAAETALLHW
ncbi:MAG: type III polyketide synthase [Bryobacter sp.]